MPSTTSSCVSMVRDSSTVMTPSLPTLFIASAMMVPICGHDAAPGPPVRVDPGRVSRLGAARGRRLRLSGPLRARRRRTPRPRPAHPPRRPPPAGAVMTAGPEVSAGPAGPASTVLTVPELCLVVLVGISGSGKSTFARAHFKPTEVISSDFCRGLVADDENDQSATKAAFELLHY